MATQDLVLRLDEWPRQEGHDMEFTLVYDGPLYGASRSNPRADHKHEIRKQFHPQVKTIWESKLSHWFSSCTPSAKSKRIYAGLPPVQSLASRFSLSGFGFVPLVLEELMLACKLDILFLRRDSKRSIIMGGDIDNRLKTLFDALRVPKNAGEISGNSPEPDESPFFVLLEDDSLITEVHVSTDTLLTPIDPKEPAATKLIVRVTLRPFQNTEWNEDFG
jgi:hypothetical protein